MISRPLREGLFLCLLALAPAAWTGWHEVKFRADTPLQAGEVTLANAEAWGPNGLWVDARSAAKFSHRHIPGSLPLTAEEWDTQVTKFLDEWDPEKHVIVYGDSGADNAATVALRLREEMKIPEVWVLHGGFEAWDRR